MIFFFFKANHLRCLTEYIETLAIGFDKRKGPVRNLEAFRQCAHPLGYPAQVVSWQAWKEMVFYLQMQSAAEPIQPSRQVNVGGCQKLLCCKIDGGVLQRHREVIQCDLNVQNAGSAVRNRQEQERGPAEPCRQRKPRRENAKPSGFRHATVAVDVNQTLRVKIPSSQRHHRIKGQVLYSDQETAEIGHMTPMIVAEVTFGAFFGEGEDRRMLHVRVVLLDIRQDVMDAVRRLPPVQADSEATDQQRAQKRHRAVTDVVTDERELLPEYPKRQGRRRGLDRQKHTKQSKQRSDSRGFAPVKLRIQLKQTFVSQLLMKLQKRGCAKRWFYTEASHLFPRSLRVDGGELLGAIAPRHRLKDLLASRVLEGVYVDFLSVNNYKFHFGPIYYTSYFLSYASATSRR